ncbi:hypothetical protein JOS77_03630 [Chromobacterium haemolyticum]|nr:hypothetical protein JOS77_03630 [Chromobacterium haemolyticum]
MLDDQQIAVAADALAGVGNLAVGRRADGGEPASPAMSMPLLPWPLNLAMMGPLAGQTSLMLATGRAAGLLGSEAEGLAAGRLGCGRLAGA